MRILDESGIEISPDYSKGYVQNEKILKQHHEAVEAVQEVYHYETVKEYANGGKDVKRVIDVPGVKAQEAWDEYETIGRFIPYTEEELLKSAEPTEQDDTDSMLVDHEFRLTMLELGV